MKTSQLENVYLKKLTDKSLKAYNKQKNYVSRCIVECFLMVQTRQLFQTVGNFGKL